MLLGTGCHGHVVSTTLDGLPCAKKTFRREGTLNDDFVTERAILIAARGAPNVVQIQEWSSTASELSIYLELGSFDLLTAVLNKSDLVTSPSTRRLLKRDMKNGLLYLHSELRVAHMDVKAENVIVVGGERGAVAKWADMVTCVGVDPNCTLRDRGTESFLSPAFLAGIPYDNRLHDTWALACVFFILQYGFKPYERANATDVRYHRAFPMPGTSTVQRVICLYRSPNALGDYDDIDELFESCLPLVVVPAQTH